MQEISNLPVYTGTIPNKKTQTDTEFANNVFGFLNYSGNVFVGNFNTIVGQFNVLSGEINTAAEQVAINKTFVANAKTSVEQTIAVLANGTINDTTAGSDKTYSSNKIESALGGSSTRTFKVANGILAGEAVNKGQLDTKADLGGSSTQKFKVDRATESDEAVQKAQLDSAVPTGLIIINSEATVPTGFLECNGALISRIVYSDLFAVIGTTYGAGDGSTTFKIPDLRGEFIRGWDHGRGIDSGRSFGSSQTDTFKAHTHEVYNGTLIDDNRAYDGIDNSSRLSSSSSNRSTTSSGGSETRPRNIAMMYCIKY